MRRADAGAERREDRQPLLVLRGAVAQLGDARDIRVVGEVDVATEAVLEELLGLEVDPLLRDVRGRQRAAVLDDRGEGDAERDRRVGDTERLEHLRHRGEHVLAAQRPAGSRP